MSTKSFTREIRISDPEAIRKIRDSINTESCKKRTISLRDLREHQVASRKKIAGELTKIY